jgi:hypothetical protein
MVANQYPTIHSRKNVNEKEKGLAQDRKVSIKVETHNLSDL